MAQKITFETVLEDYLAIDIKNSAFSDIQNSTANVKFSLELEKLEGGLSITFGQLESIVLNYDGYLEYKDEWTPIEDIFNNFSDWSVKTSILIKATDDNFKFVLEEISVDVIKKEIELIF